MAQIPIGCVIFFLLSLVVDDAFVGAPVWPHCHTPPAGRALGRGKDCNDQKIIRMMGDRLGMASQKMTLSHLQVSVFWVADMYRSGGNGNSGEF
jgi:hypothetical protein